MALNKVFNKRTGLEFGGVRAPIYNLAESDLPIVDEAVKMIEKAAKKYI